MSDRIEVPIGLDDVEVTGTKLVDGQLEVSIVSTLPAACFHCGSIDVIGHGRFRRRVRDMSLGYPTLLIWSQRRLLCNDCGRSSRERHPAVSGQRRITNRFIVRIGQQACRQPWVEVAASERVSWWRVSQSFEHALEGFTPTDGPPARVLSIDEAAFRKRFRYHTIISAPGQRRVVGVTPGRNQSTCETALRALPDAWKDTVETVVIDMFWPFRKAIENVLPDTRIVVDKFHVVRSIDGAAHKVRVRYGRRHTVVGRDGGLSRQHNPRFAPGIWQARWTFGRRHSQLTESQRETLDGLFADHPEIGLAWLLKETFAAIYQADTRTEAEHRLNLWIHHVGQADLPEFSQTWKNVARWKEPILAYFDDRQTNAYAEGITNKIKVLKRRSYGFRNQNRYRDRILMACH